MRIVVLGDFHLNSTEYQLTEQAMEDINACSPDLIVPLGDFGSNPLIGGVEGLQEAYRFLQMLQAPLRPILGNHDMQRETGGIGMQPCGTMERAFLDLFGLDKVNGVIDTDDVRLIFVGTDLQPPDSCYINQECYVTPEHFTWLKAALKERGVTPVIIFTHAPPAGAGLRTVPRVHVRATNAYLDQNHEYERWMELVHEHSQIKMWFSAHYHLGHDYPDSSTERHGTTFFMTGVHGSCSRDQSRQSRVIDIDAGGIQVSTMDHIARKLRSEPDWMMPWKTERLTTAVADTGQAAGTATVTASAHPVLLSRCVIGEASALPWGILPLEDGSRCLVATSDGFLWELHIAMEAVMGTLHLGPVLSAAAVGDDGVWRAWGNKLVRSDKASLMRFQRHKPEEVYPDMVVLGQPITCLASKPGGGVWAACSSELWRITLDGKEPLVRAAVMEEPICKMAADANGLHVLTGNQVLYRLDERGNAVEIRQGIIDWDAYKGMTAEIVSETPDRVAVVRNLSGEIQASWPVEADSDHIVLMDDGYALWCSGSKCYMWNGIRAHLLNEALPEGAQIDGFARYPSLRQGNPKFCLAVSSSAEHSRPELQIWHSHN